jgi:flavin reductase (DIM6/NTAB) family NADH-FMN oxidoreductase RutF
MTIDPSEFRRTMGLFATGVTVITARSGDIIHGMTANAVTSVSLDPLLVLFCVDNRARMAQIISESGRFAINVLSQRQEALSRHFGGRPVEGMEISFTEVDGVPTLTDNLATLICTVDRICDGGDHRVIFGRVDALTRGEYDVAPLLYYAGAYRQLALQPS